jgi:hypothetical protein
MPVCPVCGNEGGTAGLTCRFCGADIKKETTPETEVSLLHKIVNLEQGRPTLETALKRLNLELVHAKAGKIKVLTLIHGYGSSGKGGIIRVECRKMLNFLLQQKNLNSCIHGEDFNRRSGAGKALLRRFPQLEQLCGSDFNNPGVTIVIFDKLVKSP